MRAAVGGSIAVILLGLYLLAWKFAFDIVTCASSSGCGAPVLADWTSGYATALSTVGGLISALVIAELSITEPGDTPGAQLLGDTSGKLAVFLKFLVAVYLVAWLLSGLVAFIVGVMQHPDVLPAFTDLGQAWLGLAVAGGYAYFGIKPKKK